jgi:hypothetical protein
MRGNFKAPTATTICGPDDKAFLVLDMEASQPIAWCDMKYESKPKALFRNAFSGSARVPSQSQVLSLKSPMRVVVLAEKRPVIPGLPSSFS